MGFFQDLKQDLAKPVDSLNMKNESELELDSSDLFGELDDLDEFADIEKLLKKLEESEKEIENTLNNGESIEEGSKHSKINQKQKTSLKRIKCNSCFQVWYINSELLDKNMVCPFCSKNIRAKASVEKTDSLGWGIYKAIDIYGINILTDPNKLSGYLLDMVPQEWSRKLMYKRQHFYSKTGINISNVFYA